MVMLQFSTVWIPKLSTFLVRESLFCTISDFTGLKMNQVEKVLSIVSKKFPEEAVFEKRWNLRTQDVYSLRMLKHSNGQPLLENKRTMQKKNKRDVPCYQLKVKNIPAKVQVRDPSAGPKNSDTLTSRHFTQRSIWYKASHSIGFRYTVNFPFELRSSPSISRLKPLEILLRFAV